MKKLLLAFSMLICVSLVFSQDQVFTWSGAAPNKPNQNPLINPVDDAVTVPDGFLIWAQSPQCEYVASSEIITAEGVNSNCADDFEFASNQEVSSVRWWFGTFNGSYSAFTSWTITIYEDNACLPGNILGQWTVPFASSHESYNCTSIVGDGYVYWVDLVPSFVASPNTRYWISVQAGDHIFPGQLGWDMVTTSITGCPGAFRAAVFGFPDFVPGANVFGYDTDFAFELYGGAPVPVSNWALFLAVALIAIGVSLRLFKAK